MLCSMGSMVHLLIVNLGSVISPNVCVCVDGIGWSVSAIRMFLKGPVVDSLARF